MSDSAEQNSVLRNALMKPEELGLNVHAKIVEKNLKYGPPKLNMEKGNSAQLIVIENGIMVKTIHHGGAAFHLNLIVLNSTMQRKKKCVKNGVGYVLPVVKQNRKMVLNSEFTI